MIGLFANEKHAITNEIDVKKIEQIIDKIKYIIFIFMLQFFINVFDIIFTNYVRIFII